MADGTSSKDRILAEQLMRVWHESHDSALLQGDPLFDFREVVSKLLLNLGMEWDTSHGYVFPWTDRSKGPFPMTGTTLPQCSKESLSTAHQWKMVGLARPDQSPLIIRVVYVCEACSSWTYHEMDFVGYKQESLQDRLDRESDDDDDDSSE